MENRSQISAFSCTGFSAESIPIRLFPLRINGKTDALKLGLSTNPQQVTVPSYFMLASIADKIFPPATSTAISHIPLPIGPRIDSVNSVLDKISAAPIFVKKLAASLFPVRAVTSAPRWDKSFTAIQPTPPVAPLTTAFIPFTPDFSSSALTHNPAVNPAVPRIMDSFAVRFSGRFTAQPAGTRIYSPKPPAVFIPRS